MEDGEKLALFKAWLLIKTDAFDETLRFFLKSAEELIEREKIQLTDSVEDNYLLIRYATFLYESKRTQTAASELAMPRSLRAQLNLRRYAELMEGRGVDD